MIFLFLIFSSFIHNEILIPSEPFGLLGVKEISLFETSISKFEEAKKDILLFSLCDWLIDSRIYHFTYYNKKIKLGASISYFDFGRFEYYEKASNEPVFYYKPFSILSGVYYSLKIDPELHLNLGAKYIYSVIHEYTSKNILFDFFLFFKPLRFKFLKAEGGIRNFGIASKFDKRYYSEPFLFFMNLEISYRNFISKINYKKGLWEKEDLDNNFNFAISYNIIKNINLLVSFSYPQDLGFFSFGFEIIFPFINLRYSYKPSSFFDDLHYIGITNAGI
ncbi:MAG: hypothetical protein ABIM29_01760 [candidate division WOR-3 bacterium]